MGMIDRQKMAQAAERVVRRSNTQITEVIEKDEDQSLAFADRFAAAAAAFLVCGLVYFAIWLWLWFELARVDTTPGPLGWLWHWTWRAPFVATLATGLFAFVRPGMAYRHIGSITKAIGLLLMYLS